ncbi:MAG: hypothetical protein FXF54_04930 [Kosmotoga sp.]|jgi:hypothetical protein|nr:MAG: hypothetical protein FXF54_04930 [Kosmotoga sp.]
MKSVFKLCLIITTLLLIGCTNIPEEKPDVWRPVEITSLNSTDYITYITVYGVLKNVSDKPIKEIWCTVRAEDNYNSGKTTMGLTYSGDGLLPGQSADFSVDVYFIPFESSYEFGCRVDEVVFTDGTKWEAK